MSQIIKPQNPVINWGHPLSKGLVGAWLFNDGAGKAQNLVNNQSGATLTNFTSSISTYGIGLVGNGTNSVATMPAFSAALSPYTVAVGLVPTISDANEHQILDTNNDQVGLSIKANVIQFWDGSNSNTGTTTVVSTAAHNILFTSTVSVGGLKQAYLDGKLEINTSPSTNAFSTGTFFLFNNGTGGTRWLNANMQYLYIWNRYMPATAARALHTNPFQIYQQSLFPYANSIVSYFNDLLMMFR